MSEQNQRQEETGINTGKAPENKAVSDQIHKQSLKILKRLPAIGPILLLYMQSAHRRFQFISDLEWLLIPPLVGGQCKLYMKEEYPISYISWAFLDEAAEKRMFLNGGKLRPEDWKSGDRLWIIDIVAPFGGVENMLADIQRNEFPDQLIRLIVPDAKTGGIATRELQPFNKKKRGKPQPQGSNNPS